MIVYTIIILYLLIGVFIFDILNKKNGSNIYYFFSFCLLVGMSTLRYRVGGDSLHYEDIYEHMPNLNEYYDYLINGNQLEYQPLWLLFVAICRSITTDYTFYQFIHSLIFNISFFIFINKYTKKKFTYLFIFFISLMYFYYAFEIQRETIAISIFLFNIKNLEEKNWLKYYLLATLSFFFHISAIFLFFLPLFQKLKFTKIKIYILVFVSLLLLVFKNYLIHLITPFLFLESMKNKAQDYSKIEFSTFGLFFFYFVRVILLLPIIISLNKDKIMNKYNWFLSSYLIISILSQYFVAFERLLNYLNPIYIILIVRFLYLNVEDIRLRFFKKPILLITFLHVFFILEYKLLIVNKYGQHYYSLFFPYESVLNPKDHEERELFYSHVWELN